MNLKTIMTTLALSVLLSGAAWAQTQLQSEESEGLSPSRPDSLTITTPQSTTSYAISSLLRTSNQKAGADMKDSKDLTKPSTSSDTDDWFSNPSVYSEYKYTKVQDTRAFGPDGDQHTGIVGMDFESIYKTIVGFNFSYSNVSLTDNSLPAALPSYHFTQDNYFFSPYIAKNFIDWINVGASFTYGRSATDIHTDFAAFPFGAIPNISQDSYTGSVFAGVSHTWGAFSFSSTPTYLYGYNHFEFNPAPPAAPIGDVRTITQTFLELNNFQYAINDQWSISAQANYTRVLEAGLLPVAAGTPASTAHQWMEFGARVDYNFNKDGSIFAAFEHDAFNVDYDNYNIRTGVSYNF